MGAIAQATSREVSVLSFPALCLLVLYVFAQSRYPFLFLIAPMLIFIAFRLGVAGAAFGMLLTAIIAIALSVSGHGPTQLILGTETERLLVLQVFLAFTALSTLPVAAAVSQHARIRAGLEEALREVEQADAMRVAEANARPQSDDIADVTLGSLAGADSGTSAAVDAAPKIIAAVIGVLGIAVLLGWLLGIEALKTVLPNYESMKPLTAVSFILSAIVLYLTAPKIRASTSGRARTVLSVLILAPSAFTLASYAFPIYFHIDELLTAALPSLPEDAMHRMSIVTALEFALFAAAMLLPRRRSGDQAFIILTFAGMLLSLLVFAGYLYDLPILYAPIRASSIAVHTAVAFFVLFVGAAMTRPHTGWVTLLSPQSVTGAFAPWLLPAIAILPIAFGWVLNRAIRESIITAELGVDLFALSTVFFLTVVAWRTGVIANRLGRHLELREQLELRLREARVAAEDAAAAKSDFLANMSHELRTPLNSIIGFASLLARSEALEATDRRYVQILDESSQSLLTLVNDILDFSSLEYGGIALNPKPFSLSHLLEHVTARFSLFAQEKELKIETVIDEAVAPALFGDEMRIKQIIVNLIGNAVKFTAKGAVTIAVRANENSLVQGLRIEVRDTGIGIASDKLKTLFGRFAQADASIHSRFGGTGLGLAICKRLVELMGGEIGVDSAENVGTTFWFTLDLPRIDASALVEATENAGPRTTGRRILIVDDVDLNRELVTSLLAPRGHQIDLAASGSEAIKAVQAADYDLVLMDVQMPGMDGLAATRAIRALDGYAKLPIVAMTAQALPAQIAACHAAGMDDYLAKPIIPATLFDVIDKWAVESPSPDVILSPAQEATLAKLRETFVARCAADLAHVKLLLASDKPDAREDLHRLVHRFAGIAGTFGFADIGNQARELDEALSRGEAPHDSDYDRFIAKLEQLVEAA